MELLHWYKELETGIEILDSQHKKFFTEANKFIIRYRAKKGAQAAADELEFLQDYIYYHFQTEETFQYESQYPGHTEHQAEHKQLAFQVKTMAVALQDAEASHSKEVLEQFADFVNKWVKKHILQSDLKFSYYYRDYIKSQKGTS